MQAFVSSNRLAFAIFAKMPRLSKHKVEALVCLGNIARTHTTELHVAFVLKRNKILGIATNRIGSRSRGCGYSTRTIHAERAVLKKVDRRDLRGAELIVVRLSNNRLDLKGSEPCHSCKCHLQKCFEEDGLRAVYYS